MTPVRHILSDTEDFPDTSWNPLKCWSISTSPSYLLRTQSLDRWSTSSKLCSVQENEETIRHITAGTMFKLDNRKVDRLLKTMEASPSKIADSHFRTITLCKTTINLRDAQILAKIIRHPACGVRVLHLSNNRLTGEPLRRILRATRKCATLEEINLSFNGLGDRDAKALAKSFYRCPCLASVNLQENRISHTGAKYVADALSTNETIQRLSLDGNTLTPLGGQYIGKMLKRNNKLRSLYLGGNGIGAEGTCSIADALTYNTTLFHLKLDLNDIGIAGVSALATALSKNQTLKSLNLARNNLGDVAVGKLCAELGTNCHLELLSLEFNGITAAGAEKLAHALETNSNLVGLDLSLNFLKDQGLRYLAGAMRLNTTLKHLVITNNFIGVDGTQYLCESLAANNTLRYLALNENPEMGRRGYLKITELLRRNYTCLGIQLDFHCDNPMPVYDQIQFLLLRNLRRLHQQYIAAYLVLNIARILLAGAKTSMGVTPKSRFLLLPQEVKEAVVFGADTHDVLDTPTRLRILHYACDHRTLHSDCNREHFLKKIFGQHKLVQGDAPSRLDRLWTDDPEIFQ